MSGDLAQRAQRALDALDEALFAEIGARFRVLLVGEYGQPSTIEGMPKLGPSNLDGALTAFERGLDDMVTAHARCREVISKRFREDSKWAGS